MGLGVERHAFGAVLTLGGLELVENLPMRRQFLPEQLLGLGDVVEFLAELVYIVAQVRAVVVSGLLFSVVGQFADRVEFFLSLAVAFRYCANRTEHTTGHATTGSYKAAYGGDPQRIMEGQGAT